MSYDISFKVKVEGINQYVPVGYCDANITWNVRKVIEMSTGLSWINEANNGYVKDVIPHIRRGMYELCEHSEKYKPYEAENGWGTVDGVIRFFENILRGWHDFCEQEDEELVNVATFWIE